MNTHLTAQRAIDLHRKLDRALQIRQDRLTLESGEYVVSRQLIPERFCHVTNNDHGLRRFLFDVEQAQDFVFDAQGVWIENSEDVRLENVTLHHAGAMGFVAQLSRHITLDQCRVIPSSERLFSTWVDATHFTDCQGHLALIDCELRGQFDDASNIHQSYSLVRSKKDKHTNFSNAATPSISGITNPPRTRTWWEATS